MAPPRRRGNIREFDSIYTHGFVRVAVGTPRRIVVAGGALLRSQARRLAPPPR